MKEEYKTALVAGGMGGVMCFFYFLAFYSGGVTLFDSILKYDVWIPILAIFFAIYYYRNGIGERGLKFFQGIWMGLFVTAVVTVVVSFLLWLVLGVLDTDYYTESIKALEKQITDATQSGKTLKVPVEELQAYIAQLKKSSISSVILDKGIRYTIFGLPATIVASVLFRK